MVESNCSSLEAVNRIYEIKGRKHTSPLAICVGDVPDIERFAVTDHLPHGLLETLLPGPVTLVLRRGLQLIALHFQIEKENDIFLIGTITLLMLQMNRVGFVFKLQSFRFSLE